MQRERVPENVSQLAFEFFFWFSRFESALKENGYLKSNKPGARTEPNWELFVQKWGQHYTVSSSALSLLALSPETQVVAKGGDLDWEPTKAKCGESELGVVVLMLKTVRNNLLHGAKHGTANWDDLTRTSELLTSATTILPEFAKMAGFEADYCRFY